jgi:hypothetical protein
LRINFVLIDYENVQPAAISALEKEHFKVIVFVGSTQTKVTYEVATVLQHMGSRAEYVKISGNGPNALDFHIAFYIGQIAAKEPDAYFHIVSKDTGFDPLIAHLKSKKIFASRSKNVTEIPIIKAANTKTTEEKIVAILDNLKQRGASKPRTVKTLSSTIQALFQRQLADPELSAILTGLQRQGAIIVTDTKVSYNLPE